MRSKILKKMQNALAHHQAGRLQEAEAIYQSVLKKQPKHPVVLHLLGVVAYQTGKIENAVNLIEKALAIQPDYSEAIVSLGNALQALGRQEETISYYEQALALKPDDAEVHINFGMALHALNRQEEAISQYEQTLALKPDYADAYSNMGAALKDLGRMDEAIVSLGQALALKPDSVEAYGNLGNVFHELGRQKDAIANYEKCLGLKPKNAEAHNNLGTAYQKLCQYEKAISHYEQALALKPDYAEVHNNLGTAFQELGQRENAIAHYQQALSIKPNFTEALVALIHQMQHICLWENIEDLFQRVITMVKNGSCNVAPFSFMALPTTAEQHLHCARQYIQKQTIGVNHLYYSNGSSCPHTKKTKIRLGYISADFRQHPMAHLITQTIEQHDRNYFEVIAYSIGPDDGSLERQRLKQAFDQFIDASEQSYMETAQQIHADGIDILIDLAGHTQYSRPRILAQRPAPIQVNYLGHPGTMGADFIDYIIMDHFTAPAGYEDYFSEKLVRMPDCYMATDRTRAISERQYTRSEFGLPEDEFVFCCFNGTYKIMPEKFEVWMRLLKAVPGSVLWLLESNEWAAKNLKAEASRRGVAGVRLVFAEKLTSTEYLARMRLADLFLDTTPYNAHTTASEALWVGLPLLTCPGQTFASRVAASLLMAIGLPELIAEDMADYEAKALQLATNPDKLASLRQELEVNRMTTPLFDNERFTLHLENAYRQIWDIYIAGEAPQHINVQRLPLGTKK